MKNSIETSYYRITGVSLEVETEKRLMLIVRLESYLDREYRDKAQPIYSKNYHLPLTSDESVENMSIRQFAYDKLKELPEWADAVDC